MIITQSVPANLPPLGLFYQQFLWHYDASIYFAVPFLSQICILHNVDILRMILTQSHLLEYDLPRSHEERVLVADGALSFSFPTWTARAGQRTCPDETQC